MGFYVMLKTVKGELMSNAVLICIVEWALFLQGVARPSGQVPDFAMFAVVSI